MGEADVTESIYSDGDLVIPMAEVQHIEKDQRDGFKGNVSVIMKSTRWNYEYDCWDNQVYIRAPDAQRFVSAWCRYRSELENIQSLAPEQK